MFRIYLFFVICNRLLFMLCKTFDAYPCGWHVSSFYLELKQMCTPLNIDKKNNRFHTFKYNSACPL